MVRVDPLGQRVLPQQHGAGRAEAPRRGRFVRRLPAGVHRAAAARRHVRRIEDVFDGERDAVQGTAPAASLDLGRRYGGTPSRALHGDRGIAMQVGIEARDPLEHKLGELARRDRSVRYLR